MTSMTSDICALYDSIEDNSEVLREKNPDHDLLQFARPLLYDEEEWPNGVWEQFVQRFGSGEGCTVLGAMLQYDLALEVALGKRKE